MPRKFKAKPPATPGIARGTTVSRGTQGGQMAGRRSFNSGPGVIDTRKPGGTGQGQSGTTNGRKRANVWTNGGLEG